MTWDVPSVIGLLADPLLQNLRADPRYARPAWPPGTPFAVIPVDRSGDHGGPVVKPIATNSIGLFVKRLQAFKFR
jgi:hypothetical protein